MKERPNEKDEGEKWIGLAEMNDNTDEEKNEEKKMRKEKECEQERMQIEKARGEYRLSSNSDEKEMDSGTLEYK